jgi:hypothetical protein
MARELARRPAPPGHVPGRAFADNYRCEKPEDLEELERIGYPGGNALENLVDADAVAPADILSAGLTILPALARLCLSDSVSILHRTA